jgi:hypothetical protein
MAFAEPETPLAATIVSVVEESIVRLKSHALEALLRPPRFLMPYEALSQSASPSPL